MEVLVAAVGACVDGYGWFDAPDADVVLAFFAGDVSGEHGEAVGWCFLEKFEVLDHLFQSVDDVAARLCAFDVCCRALFLLELCHDFVEVVACRHVDGHEFGVPRTMGIELFDEFLQMILLAFCE